ncbi:MAG: PLP-dependent aminotransferase family protein [Anaerolineae bacterium]|nr:PLP-dependent aminotransferase family protein [Anaerolineae bacterium]
MGETVIKFTRGVPPPESFPARQLAECAKDVLEKNSAIVLQYGPAGGYQPLRQWIAQSCQVQENRIVLGQGSLQLLDILSKLLLTQGDVAYTEEPTYDRAFTLLQRAGARVIGFPLTKDGPDINQMEARLINGERPKLYYTIPDFQNPSGMVISLDSRKKMLSLAEKYDFWIIEDSPYRYLRYYGSEIPSLFEQNPNRVIRMSSFSKLISPGLRVGYAVLPEALAVRVLKYAEDTYINASYFNQAIVMDYIEKGWLETNLESLKQLYTPRLDTILAALKSNLESFGKWHKPEGGFFVGFTANFPLDADKLLKKAEEFGVQLTDGRGFFVNGDGNRFIRLPFCALTPEEIETGIHRLAKVLDTFRK